ncbi:Hypothetical predicted protein [Cloeon dipterum]|nr:Hypothetical predicted protein [Cloeon dipterum]
MTKKQKRSVAAVAHEISDEEIVEQAVPQKKSKKKVKVDIPIFSTDDIDDLIVSERSVFPTDLKQRHPLFGADYEERCSLTGLCRHPRRDSSVTATKERKKKRVKDESMDCEEASDCEQNIDHDTTSKHLTDLSSKKRKKKWTVS